MGTDVFGILRGGVLVRVVVGLSLCAAAGCKGRDGIGGDDPGTGGVLSPGRGIRALELRAKTPDLPPDPVARREVRKATPFEFGWQEDGLKRPEEPGVPDEELWRLGGRMTLRVGGDGRCIYTDRNAPPGGGLEYRRLTFSIPPERVERLRALVVEAGLLEATEAYQSRLADGPRVLAMVRAGGAERRVYCDSYFPRPVRRVAEFIHAEVIGSRAGQIRLVGDPVSQEEGEAWLFPPPNAPVLSEPGGQ